MTMTIRRAALALVLLPLMPAPAQAQDDGSRYRFVVTVGNSISMIEDTSLVRDGDVRTFWMLQLFVTPPTAPTLRDVAYMRVQMNGDCRRRTIERLRYVGHASDGRVIDDLAAERGALPVRPESSGAWLLDYACDGRLRPDASTLPAMPLATALAVARRTRERDAASTAER